MNFKSLRAFVFISILFLSSCTPYKQVPYFQGLKRDSVVTEKIINYTPLTMQPGDLLGIHVSSMNHEADLIYNYNLERQIGVDLDRTEQTTVVGYIIDQEGNINLPIIGIVKVSGYTTKQISTELESKLQVYLSRPSVNVRILNFKVSVLGDVKFPGSFTVQNEKITVPQAISLAGDLNSTGIRGNVLLIREINGERQYVNINLASKNIFSSPYYYLKSNDILYIQPNRIKVSADKGLFEKVGIVFSLISIIIYLIK